MSPTDLKYLFPKRATSRREYYHLKAVPLWGNVVFAYVSEDTWAKYSEAHSKKSNHAFCLINPLLFKDSDSDRSLLVGGVLDGLYIKAKNPVIDIHLEIKPEMIWNEGSPCQTHAVETVRYRKRIFRSADGNESSVYVSDKETSDEIFARLIRNYRPE